MLIKSVALNNFRSYAGRHDVEMATEDARNVTLVHGVSGAGKTSLFLAINFALFGLAITFEGNLVNDQALERSADGFGSGTASVAVSFIHDRNDYYLSRGVGSDRAPSGLVTHRELGVELYHIDASGNSRAERFPDPFLRSLLPAPIRTFFFFDGDKITEFAKPGKHRDAEITKAVNNVLQLDLIERAARHVTQVSRDIEREIATKGSPLAQALVTKKQDAEGARDRLDAQRTSIDADARIANAELEEVNREFETLAAVREKAQHRLSLERELRTAAEDVAERRAQLMSAARAAIALPILNKLQSAKAFLDSKRRKREIPANYKDQFLRDLLVAGNCICERPLVKGTDEWAHIESLLERTVPGGVQDLAITLAGQLRANIKKQGGTVARIAALESTLRRTREHRDSVENELRRISAEIKEDAESNAAKLEARRGAILELIKRKSVERAQTVKEIEVLTVALEKLEDDLRREIDKEAKLRDLKDRRRIAVSASAAFERIRTRLISDLRIEMGMEATEIFESFTWKRGYFDRIDVREDYLIAMLGVDGTDLRAGMSMGETQLLSLAFMLSMISISEYEAPLVIDMPVARLSREVRTNLLRALPGLTRQLVLLCTDTEIDAEGRRALGDRVGEEYHLVFVDGYSQILAGPLP